MDIKPGEYFVSKLVVPGLVTEVTEMEEIVQKIISVTFLK